MAGVARSRPMAAGSFEESPPGWRAAKHVPKSLLIRVGVMVEVLFAGRLGWEFNEMRGGIGCQPSPLISASDSYLS
jgi:hypothetical protein